MATQADKKSHSVSLEIVFIAFLGLSLYSNILHATFIFDDYSSIVDNDTIKNFELALKDFSNDRYLTYLTFAINYEMGGLKPFGYHLVNNIIHVINAILVYYLVIVTFRTPYFSYQPLADRYPQYSYLPIHRFTHSPVFIAVSSAFIFVSHPIQTQAVTYIAQRAASMATMFYLFSLVMYIKWRLIINQKSENKHKISDLPSAIWYLISLISAILAMRTKEIAFTLPVTVALYELSFFNKSPNSQIQTPKYKRFLYLLPIILTMLIIPLSMVNIKGPIETAIRSLDMQTRDTPSISREEYLFTQFRVIITYLRLLLIPIRQSVDYTYPLYHSFLNHEVFLSFLFLVTLFTLAVYLYYISHAKRHSLRMIAFGIFWFFITISVESSISPLRNLIVEHRLYLPSIGFFIALVSLTGYLFQDQRIRTALIIVIVLMLSIGTYKRNVLWKDPQILWEDVLTKYPDNVMAYNELGLVFKDQGRYDMAIEQFKNALRLRPNYSTPYYNLGYIQYKLGNYEDAIAYFRKALTLGLNNELHLDVLNSLAITYNEMGDDNNAINTFKMAIQLHPKSTLLYNNLGRQYTKMGEYDLAIDILKKGLNIREEPYLYHNLSIANAKKMGREKTTEKNR